MKHVLLLIALVIQLFIGGVAFAQTSDTSIYSKTLLANVSLTNATLVHEGSNATISFTLTNRSGVQPGVKYAVILARETETTQTIEDTLVFEEVLALIEGESVVRSIVYTAPLTFSGTYTVYVQSANEVGFIYGMVPAGTITLPERGSKLSLLSESCYLTVDGGKSTKKYTPYEIAPLEQGETLVSHCVLKNETAETLIITPRFTMNSGSLYGPTNVGEGGSPETLTLMPNEEKMVVTELPHAQSSGTYAVTVSYDSEGNSVSYSYRTTDAGIHISNVIFDSVSYQKGDIANIRLILGGTSMEVLQYLLDVRDVSGSSCAETISGSAQNTSLQTNIDVSVPISENCSNPETYIQIVKNDGAILYAGLYSVNLPRGPLEENAFVNPMKNGNTKMPLSIWFSVIGLALGLGFFFHSLSKKGKISVPPATPLIVLLACISFGFVVAPYAEAANFTQGGCSVSISQDPVSQIRTGQSVNVYGYTSCPGLQVDAVFLAAGYGFSVTANAFGGFFGSFSAPPQDDVIQYVSGDHKPDVFGLGNPVPPSDFIFVNYCPPGYLEYCEIPPYATIFGEKVGWSGGACGAGSTGNCNYTCQPDLTWRKNSNSCSVPPPPPPGSTPTFTTVPSCFIQANASSCSATVGIFVPAAYWLGVDLTTQSGTLLQSFMPGSYTTSVTIPYNSGVFQLRQVFSFNVFNSVTGTATCAPGTNWNGSVCAPLPPPATPTGLSAQTGALCGSKTINVSWNPSANATSYDLERDGVLLSGAVSPYPDLVITDGSIHQYRVRAWNGSGVSAWSAPYVQGTAPNACAGVTGAITITTCSIQVGQSSCSATVSWTTTGAIAPNIAQGGTVFSTAPTDSMGTSRTITYGTNTFMLKDGPTTVLDTETISGSCTSGTTWNGSTCETNPLPPSTRPCGGTEILGCQLDPTAHQGTDGTCNPVTYTGTCSYTCDDSAWGAPSNNSCVLLPPPPVTGPPTLTTTSRLVKIGTSVQILWDTNNKNESLCTLTGGSLGTAYSPIPLNASDPNAEQGSVNQTIGGRTTYTLMCPSGTVTLVIEVIPVDSET